MRLVPMRVGLMCRFTLAKWCSVKMPTMPTTMAVSMTFATVKSSSSNWPMSTLYFPKPPFCRRKPNAKPKITPANSFGAVATAGVDFSVDCSTAFPGSIMVPHSLKSSIATAIPPIKKQTTAIHDARLSWSVPLMP